MDEQEIDPCANCSGGVDEQDCEDCLSGEDIVTASAEDAQAVVDAPDGKAIALPDDGGDDCDGCEQMISEACEDCPDKEDIDPEIGQLYQKYDPRSSWMRNCKAEDAG